MAARQVRPRVKTTTFKLAFKPSNMSHFFSKLFSDSFSMSSYSMIVQWFTCDLFSMNSGISLRIGETEEYWKVTGGLLWKGKALSGNKQNLAGEFCVVAEEFSDLRCLMKTLMNLLNNVINYELSIIHTYNYMLSDPV